MAARSMSSAGRTQNGSSSFPRKKRPTGPRRPMGDPKVGGDPDATGVFPAVGARRVSDTSSPSMTATGASGPGMWSVMRAPPSGRRLPGYGSRRSRPARR